MPKAVISILILVFLSSNLAAQSTATLTGTVVDASGAIVAGARVVCRNLETDAKSVAVTNSIGLFNLPYLPVGGYELTISHEGFGTLVRGGVELLTGQTVDLTLKLKVGQVSQSVEVTAPVPLVQSTTSDVGATVDSRQMGDLPLNGRNAFELALLAAGAIDTDAATLGGESDNAGLAVNGLRPVDNNWQLDGATYTNPSYGSAPTLPNPDTLQEFTARTSNFDAASRGAGASINLTTRSGTNQLHGTLFEFLRNDAFDARNFFSVHTEPYKLNQYGGTLGGPVKKDKLFFFGSVQGTNQRGGPSPESLTVPDAAQRMGDYLNNAKIIVDPVSKKPFPNNIIPQDRQDAIALKLMSYIPLPNAGGNSLFSNPTAGQDDFQWLAKLDYILSSKDRLSGRYFWDRNTRDRDVNSVPGFYADTQLRNQTLVVSDTHTFGPSWIMTASFNYLRTFTHETPTAPTTMQELGAKVPYADAGDPGNKMYLSINGYTYFYSGMGTDKKPALEESKVDFSHASGRHLLRFGSGVRHDTSEGLRRVNSDNGYWTFTAARTTLSTVKNSGDAFASFLLGLPATFTQKSSAPNDFVVTTFDAWVQDDWKISRRLTLNLGLRYDPWLPAHDTTGYTAGFLAGRQSTVAPLAPSGLVFGGDAGIPPSIIRSDWWTFAPRAGFAWDVAGNGKTIVRSSYGIFRFSTEFFGMLNNLGNGMPFRSASVSITNPPSTADPYANYGPVPFPYTQPASIATYAFGANLSAQAFDVNTKPGYNQSWNFTVERQVARDAAVTVSYVGNHAIDIITRYSANPAIYGPGATTGNENSRRLYKGFGDLLLGGSIDYSNYEALQAQFTKRAAHGLTVLANYTYGKAMSIDSSGSLGTATGSGPHNPLNRRADYGPADYDVTHNFKLTFIYDLPATHRGPSALRGVVNGWQVNSIVNARTGLPFTCRSGVRQLAVQCRQRHLRPD